MISDCVPCARRTLHRVTEIQNILNGFNLSPQILAHLGSPSDSLVREVLALQNILLLNANNTVQVCERCCTLCLYEYSTSARVLYSTRAICRFVSFSTRCSITS